MSCPLQVCNSKYAIIVVDVHEIAVLLFLVYILCYIFLIFLVELVVSYAVT
jgi:hypothetical protein